MSDEQVGEVDHRKSGLLECPADALHLNEWLNRTLLEEYQDRFGRGMRVEVSVSVRDLDKERDDDE